MKEHILAIVGIGEAGMPVIEKAKEMGVKTVGLGMADSLGKDLVDFFEEVNIFDIDGMVRVCQKHQVTGVIGPSEVSSEPAAILADKLGLPGNNIENGFFARNKYLMRQNVEKIKSVYQPKFRLYEPGLPIKYPVVVKSLDSCGKQGVGLAKTDEEFKIAINEAEKYSSDGKVLIEEYLEGGREYSVECISFKGTYSVVQITEKDSSGPPHFAETGHHQPADISSSMRKKIEIASEEILKSIGIDCGMAHLEIKIIDNKIYFIEVGARGGGDHIAEIFTPLSTDCDYYKAAIECCLGEYVPRKINNVSYCGLYYHVKNNLKYDKLFNNANGSDWLYKNTVTTDEFPEVSCNCDCEKAGYIIYNSDHKIGMQDVLNEKKFKAERINEHPKAFELIWNHNKEIGRTLSDKELKYGIEKFIRQGDVIAILEDDHIIGFLMLYCNNYESSNAYICNVYVLKEYRRCGLSILLMDKAISICEKRGFKFITLHVKLSNRTAINLYKKKGFYFTGDVKDNDKELQEMMLDLQKSK